MHEALMRVIEHGLRELKEEAEAVDGKAQRAREIVDETKARLAELRRFAEKLPDGMLQSWGHVCVGKLKAAEGVYRVDLEAHSRSGCYVRQICMPLWPEPELPPGQYEVVMMWRRVSDKEGDTERFRV